MHPRVPTSAREDAYSDSLPLYSPLYSYPSYSHGALSTLHIAIFPPSCRCAQHAGAGPRRGRAPRAGWRRGEGASAAGATAPRGGVKILRVQLALERTRVQLRSAALGCLHRSRSPRIRAVLPSTRRHEDRPPDSLVPSRCRRSSSRRPSCPSSSSGSRTSPSAPRASPRPAPRRRASCSSRAAARAVSTRGGAGQTCTRTSSPSSSRR